jgi:hypothetical protein
MFQANDKSSKQFITKREFSTWILEWLRGDEFGVDLSFVLTRFAPGALITPEQQAAFELQARLDEEKAIEEVRRASVQLGGARTSTQSWRAAPFRSLARVQLGGAERARKRAAAARTSTT